VAVHTVEMPDLDPSSVADRDRRWLSAAIELSRRSPRTPTNYAVGAIVVGPGGSALSAGYTGELGRRDHAEEVALARAAGLDLSRATLYSSLEPCTTRSSRPGTCTDLILAAGLPRVVIALREPLLFADCHGVSTLRDAGVEVIEIVDLGRLVREVNADVLDRPGDTT
jgi:diaminohydroxyphosphoribosylaminopyrimidine deaminase / 5-amino-6-(5-phosphoribosylamino)uracil reductase